MTRAAEVNVDEKLSVNKFNIDEDYRHITLTDEPDAAVVDKLIICCPAALYKRSADGVISFESAGCLECGTCRILGLGSVIEMWTYPRDGKGISYRYG